MKIARYALEQRSLHGRLFIYLSEKDDRLTVVYFFTWFRN